MEGQSCVICQKPNVTMKCGVCKRAWYCSSAHQQQDWPTHKKSVCDQLKIQENDDVRAREKFAIQIKTLVDKYAAGENNLWLVLDLSLKALQDNEKQKTMLRLGYEQVQNQTPGYEKLDKEAQDRISQTQDLVRKYSDSLLKFELYDAEYTPVLISKEQALRGHMETLNHQHKQFMSQFQKVPDLSSSEASEANKDLIEGELMQIQQLTNVSLESALKQQIQVFQRELETCVNKIARIVKSKGDFDRVRKFLESEVNNISLITN